MKKYIFILGTLLLVWGCSNNSSSDKDSKEIAEDANEERFEDTEREDDIEFVMDAADGGMLEVQLAELAMANGSSAEVKNFAQTMVKDHSQANEELKMLAANKNIVLPTSLSDDNQKDFNDLSQKTGVEFDKAYCEYMVKDHKNDLDEFKEEADKGEDADIRSWAAGKVSTLEHHLTMAESMKEVVK
jgi:putative membrane protein